VLRSVILIISLLTCAVAFAGMRDPTRPPSYDESTTAGEGGLVVSSILTSGQRNVAVINGDIVGIGDSVGGMPVLKITKDYVVVHDGEDNRVLRILPEHNIRTTHQQLVERKDSNAKH